MGDSYTLDLESKIPFWRMPEDKRREIWDDGVHFTEKGYDLMGEIITERLVELIGKSDRVSKVQKPLKGDLKKRNQAPTRVEIQRSKGKKLRCGRGIMREIKVMG
jgi:hypothetical protein